MKKSLLLLALVAIALSGCQKIKHSGFTISAIDILKIPSAPAGSTMQIIAEGPGINNLTSWYGWGTRFMSTNWQGDKASKDYEFTLIRNTNGTESEQSVMTVDFGDYLGQDEFFVENDDLRIKFYVNWDTRW